MEKEFIVDGSLAQTETQNNEFWKLRESAPSALTHIGYVYKYDISIPLDQFYTIVELMRERLKGTKAITVAYGHVGDGMVGICSILFNSLFFPNLNLSYFRQFAFEHQCTL